MGFFSKLRDIARVTVEKDPAACSKLEVWIAYPGFHAMVFYYMAHRVHLWKLCTLSRWISSIGRALTGIEIHPAAKIGERFFMDHGMGIVIGGTAEIGNDVTLYQGVTLGGTSLEPGKRHPTLKDNVTVGAGAKVLGPITIGENARIGANAVVIKDVAADTSMVGALARSTKRKVANSDEFWAYGIPTEDLPDPVARSIEGLLEHVHQLSNRVKALEEENSVLLEGSNTDDARAEGRPTKG
jgi:serine O-acetyltransferase